MALTMFLGGLYPGGLIFGGNFVLVGGLYSGKWLIFGIALYFSYSFPYSLVHNKRREGRMLGPKVIFRSKPHRERGEIFIVSDWA